MLICIFTGFHFGAAALFSDQPDSGMVAQANMSIWKPSAWCTYRTAFHLEIYLVSRHWFGQIPFLGRRRGWMLVTQIGLLLTLLVYAFLNPAQHLYVIMGLSLVVAFFSASQDIVLDAFRREILSDEELGLGNSIHVNAYRIAALVPGSLSLIFGRLDALAQRIHHYCTIYAARSADDPVF